MKALIKPIVNNVKHIKWQQFLCIWFNKIIIIANYVVTGSRTVLVNMEVRHLTSGVVSRRCMLALLEELNIAHYRAMISKGAGALLVLLPSTFDNLTATQKEVSYIIRVCWVKCVVINLRRSWIDFVIKDFNAYIAVVCTRIFWN